MSSNVFNNTMGSDSCPALLENQFAMFSIIEDETVFNMILTSDSKEAKVEYWVGDINDDANKRVMSNTNYNEFCRQFCIYSPEINEDGLRAQFRIRSRTGEHLYNFYVTNGGVVKLCQVVTGTDPNKEFLISFGHKGQWIKVLSAVM